DTFVNFGVKATVSNVHVGPAVTKYEINPEAGVKVSRIVNLHDDLALALAAEDIRIEAPIPGKAAVGIEVPNDDVAMVSLKEVIDEMINRYDLFSETGTRNLESYNEYLTKENANKEEKDAYLPYIVVIVDELADLMMVASSEVEDSITRLAQMARAAGIHLIIATQRPSVDVITGVIKANIPSRIAFSVSSQIDSRTIL